MRERGLATAEALEEAGARVTLAPSQAIAADRLAADGFMLLVLTIAAGETPFAALKDVAGRKGVAVLAVAPAEIHPRLREDFPAASLAQPGIGARDLVLFVTGTTDE